MNEWGGEEERLDGEMEEGKVMKEHKRNDLEIGVTSQLPASETASNNNEIFFKHPTSSQCSPFLCRACLYSGMSW